MAVLKSHLMDQRFAENGCVTHLKPHIVSRAIGSALRQVKSANTPVVIVDVPILDVHVHRVVLGESPLGPCNEGTIEAGHHDRSGELSGREDGADRLAVIR